jgi:glycosyltransferase involved in cell wall biosynthesis
MMKPGISVVIPLFNKALYIRATLEALIPQLGADDEILVVDDQSTDDGPDIVRNVFAACPGAGRLILLPENSGPATARNVGARDAAASHLLFFDADDIPLPVLLPTLRAAIAQHPVEAVFAYRIAFEARGETAPLLVDGAPLSATLRPLHAFATDHLRGRTLCTASSTCVRHDAFLAADGGFCYGLRYCEDPEFWARLSACHRIVQIDQTLAIYRDVAGSLSYGLRSLLGSVNPYMDTLKNLSAQYGLIYTRIARSMVFKNLIFSRAAGASSAAAYPQIARHRSTLGVARYLVLSCLNLLPSYLFRKVLEARSTIAARG